MIFNTQIANVQKTPEYYIHSISLYLKRGSTSYSSTRLNFITSSDVPVFDESDGVFYSKFEQSTGGTYTLYNCVLSDANIHIHGNIPNGRYTATLYKMGASTYSDNIGGTLVFDYNDGDITTVTNNIRIKSGAASTSSYTTHLCMLTSLTYTPPS